MLRRALLRAAQLANASTSAECRIQYGRVAPQAEACCRSDWHRGYATDGDAEARTVGTPRVQQLVEEILQLNLLEVSDLTDILKTRLGIEGPIMGGIPMGYGAPPPAAGGAAGPAAEEPKEEKTEFDVKLAGFDAASKIKIIKEIRVITELGLKEAKELVRV